MCNNKADMEADEDDDSIVNPSAVYVNGDNPKMWNKNHEQIQKYEIKHKHELETWLETIIWNMDQHMNWNNWQLDKANMKA